MITDYNRSAFCLFLEQTPTYCALPGYCHIETSNAISDLTISNMHKTLDEIKRECSEPNWDDEGSKPVKPEALVQAQAFVEMLPLNILLPSFFVRPNGDISIQWQRNNFTGLLITFTGTEILNYVSIMEDQKYAGVAKFYGQIPRDLRGRILSFSEYIQ